MLTDEKRMSMASPLSRLQSPELPSFQSAMSPSPAMMGSSSITFPLSPTMSPRASVPLPPSDRVIDRVGVPTPFTQAQALPSSLTPTMPSSPQMASGGVPMLSSGSLATPMGEPLPSASSMSPRFAGSPPLSPRTQRNVEVEEMVEQYRAEMGTDEQLSNFFENYAQHDRLSSKCYLNGRYFWKVLAPYPGLVSSELFIRIDVAAPVKTREQIRDQEGNVEDAEQIVREFDISVPIIDLEELAETKNAPVRFRLIKLLIDISDDKESNVGAVHSNLIIIDTKTKEILRFEPMFDENFTDPINTVLKNYFAEPSVLPDYSYRMLYEHPQLPSTDSCPSKGMCAAYVLKKAMMVVTGNDRPLTRNPKDEELKIMHFADAIETEYGPISEDDGLEAGFGISLGFGSPSYGPYYPYDDYYSYPPYLQMGPAFRPPPFYGYVYGPRYGRRIGHGWGARRHRMWGYWMHKNQDVQYHSSGSERTMSEGEAQQEYGRWQNVKDKLNEGYARAKSKIMPGRSNSPDVPRSANAKARKLLGEKSKPMDDDQAMLNAYGGADSREMSGRKLGLRGEEGRWHHGPRAEHGSTCGISRNMGEESMAREEYGCGCSASKPRTEYGSTWKPAAYGGVAAPGATAGASYQGGFGKTGRPADTRDIARYGEYMGNAMDLDYVPRRDEFGELLRPSTWSRQTKFMAGGAAAGIGASMLMGGGLGGAAIGGLAGAGGGALLSNLTRPQYGELFRPSTWSPQAKAAGIGAAIGIGGGLLLGGGLRGALLGGAAGGLGGYLISSAGQQRRYNYTSPPPQYMQQPYYGQQYYQPPPQQSSWW